MLEKVRLRGIPPPQKLPHLGWELVMNASTTFRAVSRDKWPNMLFLKRALDLCPMNRIEMLHVAAYFGVIDEFDVYVCLSFVFVF